MDASLVLLKTEKGEAEITSRKYKLNHALRYVLILVNGKSSVKEILDKGAGLPNLAPSLDYLVNAGFVQTQQDVLSAHFDHHHPRDEIIALANKMFGSQAAPVIKKLRESAEARDALVQTANACKRLIKLTIDDENAEEFMRRSQEIIYASSAHA